MAFRTVFSNVKTVTWNNGTSYALTGVEDISITEDAQRVAGAADDELHEAIQFMGTRTTQIQVTLQTPPPAGLGIPSENAELTGMGTLTFTTPGRLGATDKTYVISNVEWFNQGTNGAFGQMRKFTLAGHAVVEAGSPSPVS